MLDELERMLCAHPIWTDTVRMQIRLALDEALTNAVYHGNLEVGSDPAERNDSDPDSLSSRRRVEAPYRDRRVRVTVSLSTSQAEYRVEDEGRGFDMTAVPDPRDEENILKRSGRGLLIIRSVMDAVQFNDKGNCITMTKNVSEE